MNENTSSHTRAAINYIHICFHTECIKLIS